MRTLLVAMMVMSPASAASAADPFTNLGPDLPGNGGGFNDSGDIVWDNGVADGDGAWRPTPGWDPSGIVDNFTLTAGNSTFNGLHVEFVDGTFPQGTPDTTHQALRLQVFELPDNGIPGLVHPDDPGGSVPVFDRTFTRVGGTMTVTDSGQDMFSRDLLYFDVIGAPVDLGPGDFAVFVNFPGSDNPSIDSFWATSGFCVSGFDCAAVLGPGGVNNDLKRDVAFNLSIPEPSALTLLGVGALAMMRRRRESDPGAPRPAR